MASRRMKDSEKTTKALLKTGDHQSPPIVSGNRVSSKQTHFHKSFDC